MSTFLWMSAGALVWAAHFGTIYGGTALACARGVPSLVPWVVALSTLAGVGITAAIIVRSYPQRDDFSHRMAAAVAAIAIVAMLWEALAGLVVRTCG